MNIETVETGIQTSTVIELFERLNSDGICYALLRNYEAFPSFGHDVDLVCSSEDLDRVRKLLCAIAETNGWDVLTECDHFNRSTIRAHNIEIFRFYQRSTLSYLQVDLFHGSIIWGLPMFTEDDLLSARRMEAGGRFFVTDPFNENVIRLFQLAGLGNVAREDEKFERYQRRALDYFGTQPGDADERLISLLGPSAAGLLAALRQSDRTALAKAAKQTKIAFASRSLLRHPIRTIGTLIARRGDLKRLKQSRTCGLILNAVTSDIATVATLETVLKSFQSKGVIPEWLNSKSDRPEISVKEQRILHRCGVVVKSSGVADATPISVGIDSDTLTNEVLGILVDHHQIIYDREPLK